LNIVYYIMHYIIHYYIYIYILIIMSIQTGTVYPKINEFTLYTIATLEVIRRGLIGSEVTSYTNMFK